MNKALRLARLNRIARFLEDVGAVLQAYAEGRTVKSRLSKLQNYSLSITAAKSDPILLPLANCCHEVLRILTDGNEMTDEKMTKIDELHDEIRKMVGDDGV